MIGQIILLALAAYQPASAQPAQSPPAPAPAPSEVVPPENEVTVRGQRPICRLVNTRSAETRLGGTQMCLTQQEWTQRYDEAQELLADLPRRNPRQAVWERSNPAGLNGPTP